MLKGLGKIIWSKRSKFISPNNAERTTHTNHFIFAIYHISFSCRFRLRFIWLLLLLLFFFFHFFFLPCKILNHFRIISSVGRKKKIAISIRGLWEKNCILFIVIVILIFRTQFSILIPSLQWMNFANKFLSILL